MNRKAFLLPALLALASGCVNANDVVQARDEGHGVTRVYDADEKTTWAGAAAVMRWAGADTIEQHPEAHYMLGQTGVTAVSYGTLLGAWIEPVDASHVKVTVVSKRKLQTEAITAMGEDTFHNDLAKAIALQKAGQPLPPEEP